MYYNTLLAYLNGDFLESWIIIGCFSVLGLAFVGLLAVLLWIYHRLGIMEAAAQTRIAALEGALEGSRRFSYLGNSAREQYSNRRQTAIVEALSMFNAGKKPQEILLNIAQKYPDVAVQVAQNPDVILSDIKKLGLNVPTELLAQIAPSKMADKAA